MFNIYLGIFVIIAIFIIGYGTFRIYDTKQTISALIFFVGSLTLFIIFGMKWFSPNSMFSKTPVSWPPVINTCPDYLEYYKYSKGDKSYDTCIDTIGVSTNGQLKKFPKDDIPDYPVNDTDPSFYFPLATTSDPKNKNIELCKRAIKYGLTWEGITNGESCILPDGRTSTGTPDDKCS